MAIITGALDTAAGGVGGPAARELTPPRRRGWRRAPRGERPAAGHALPAGDSWRETRSVKRPLSKLALPTLAVGSPPPRTDPAETKAGLEPRAWDRFEPLTRAGAWGARLLFSSLNLPIDFRLVAGAGAV